MNQLDKMEGKPMRAQRSQTKTTTTAFVVVAADVVVDASA